MIALEQLLAPDSWARVIDLFVDILPIVCVLPFKSDCFKLDKSY